MMKRNLILAAALALLTSGALVTQHSWGEPDEENVNALQTFTVENMTCAACPITVRKAMSRVNGVQSVDVDFNAKTVTVAYDPALADTAAIAEASTSVGFPAHVVNTP